MDSLAQGEEMNDLHYRRMKNRERQRRYRERKRLQEELKKTQSSIGNELEPAPLRLPPPPPPSPTLTNGILAESGSVNRVLCKRNWKKDARCVNLTAKQQSISDHAQQQSTHENEGSNTYSETKLTDQNSVTCFSNSLIVVGDEKLRIKRGGRHWKAEARKKQEVRNLSAI